MKFKMKIETKICNNMRGLILLALLFSSCDNRTEKYFIRSEGLDGNRCEKFELSYYSNFEIAQCVECKLHFISPIKDYHKYEKYFSKSVALIYIREESDFNVLKNNVFMDKIFKHWNPNWKILSIQLNDSKILFETIGNDNDFKDFKYKIK